MKYYALVNRAGFLSAQYRSDDWSSIPPVIVVRERKDKSMMSDALTSSEVVNWEFPNCSGNYITTSELELYFKEVTPDDYVYIWKTSKSRAQFLDTCSYNQEYCANIGECVVVAWDAAKDFDERGGCAKVAGCVYRLGYLHISESEIMRYLDRVHFEWTCGADLVETRHEEPAPKSTVNSGHLIDMSEIFKTARSVKSRSKESVALHMGSEAGEVNECLVQPDRRGNIVEESVDVILCAVDLIYLELSQTHGSPEIVNEIQRLIEKKCQKWAETCKK